MAKSSDSRLRALYDDKDPDGDPLGELSDIMGISKDNDTEDDISLDLERELFGVNDDEPLSSSVDDSASDDRQQLLGSVADTQSIEQRDRSQQTNQMANKDE